MDILENITPWKTDKKLHYRLLCHDNIDFNLLNCFELKQQLFKPSSTYNPLIGKIKHVTSMPRQFYEVKAIFHNK